MMKLRSRSCGGEGVAERNGASFIDRLKPHAVAIRTARRQKLALCEKEEPVYAVAAGVVILHAILPEKRRQIFATLYPGDVFCALMMPGFDGAGATALSADGLVWRLRWPALQMLTRTDPDVALALHLRLAAQAARLVHHIASLGSLTGAERVAGLIAELAARTGTPAPSGGVLFEMPFSRKDMADYLALNPDTVSRIMSRLRIKGLLARATRGRLICHDLAALESECPLAPFARHGGEAAGYS
jgi:CRP-like cAMP-binding protein